jgi:hypothetical protein
MLKLKINQDQKLTIFFLAVVTLGLVIFGIRSSQSFGAPQSANRPDPCLSINESQYSCYENYLKNIVKTYGAKEAQTTLASLIQASSYVQSQCHPLAHLIGRTAFEKYGSVSEATKYATEVCWSGYYHGVMEAYMSGFDDTKLYGMIASICQQEPGKPYSFDYYNCVHGLGHGVTIRFDNDIFKALPFCQAFSSDKAWEKESCYSGIFMQNIVVDGIGHQSKNLRADDPVYPCNAVAADQKHPCYLMVTSNILKAVGWDYKKAFGICDGVEGAYISTCYQSMGRDISGSFLLDSKETISHCSLGDPRMQAHCYIGAVKNDVFNDRNTRKANELCSLVPEKFKGDCIGARDEAAATI